ncbi:MAG TPA: CBS domain-containing protein [Candidatus Bilamarchaeaceae archaeon]|nr:CBS domain-containing protein [Candidatus Bilamarchaeaceae archaeon]
MTRNVITISTDETIVEVAKLMKKHDIGSVIIVDGQKRAKGIVTERDVIHKLIAAGKDVASTKVEAVMSKPLRVITPDTPLEVAAQAMRKNNIKRLPVVNAQTQLVGIISEGDIMRIFPAIVDLLEERVALR